MAVGVSCTKPYALAMPNTALHLTTFLAAAAMVVFSSFASPASDAKVKGTAVDVAAHVVPFDHLDPERQIVGRLRYLGGLNLLSTDQRFGGLSALDVSADGNTLVALSDRGHWVRAQPMYSRGRLVGIRNVTMGPLVGPGGRDAEALARSDDGAMIVAFERSNRLFRYARLEFSSRSRSGARGDRCTAAQWRDRSAHRSLRRATPHVQRGIAGG